MIDYRSVLYFLKRQMLALSNFYAEGEGQIIDFLITQLLNSLARIAKLSLYPFIHFYTLTFEIFDRLYSYFEISTGNKQV